MDNLIALFTDTHLLSLNLIIFAFFIGACVAGFATVYHRRTIGELVRFLLDSEAFTPENAKSLRDAEQELNIFVRMSIRHNAAFQRIIALVPPEGTTADTAKDKRKLSDIPLYIRPEQRERAEKMYSAKTAQDANLWMVLLSIVIFGIVAYASTGIVPSLVRMVNGLFDSIG